MRWSSVLLPFSLLAVGVLAAKSEVSDRFQELHKRALSKTPVKLDDASYKQITAVPRDYTIAVLLTAMDARYSCQMCREFGPEWDLLSKSWTKGDKAGESQVVFTLLDFSDGRDTFMSLGLQTAPVLLLFRPTTGEFAVSESDPLRFDFTAGSPTADSVRVWIARHLPGRPHPKVRRPTNWMAIIIIAVAALAVIGIVTQLWPYVYPIAVSRRLWCFVSLFTILLYTSGFAFNSIRNVPYAGQDGRGHIQWISGGFQSQYGMESQVIMALYGVLAFTAICLSDKAPRIPYVKSQQIVVFASLAACFVLYSLLLSIFRMKNGGYPFSLPPFL